MYFDKDAAVEVSDVVFEGEKTEPKKQPIITLSSMEAKYVALTHAAKDILWIHKLLKEFSFLHNLSLPTTLYCDKSAYLRTPLSTVVPSISTYTSISSAKPLPLATSNCSISQPRRWLLTFLPSLSHVSNSRNSMPS